MTEPPGQALAGVMDESVEHSWNTVPVQVWVDIDREVAPLVVALNRIPGLRTFASCQGHLGSKDDTRAYVMLCYDRWRELQAVLGPLAEFVEPEGTPEGSEPTHYTLRVARESIPEVVDLIRQGAGHLPARARYGLKGDIR
jgi:hypothetical protein